MKYYYILLIVLLSTAVSAQNKEYKKLQNLFNSGEYNKCINISKKILSKKSREIMPLFYCSKANFELFKRDSSYLNLKQSLKYLNKLVKVDKKKQNEGIYSDLMKELKIESVNFANTLYYDDKNKSKIFYDYLAKIYKDTLNQFYDFHPELKPKLAESKGLNEVESAVNQVDMKGRKQGFWTKSYDNGVVAYEVYFKDDKPVGTHKRYHYNGKLMATLVFDETGEWTDAKLFDESGVLIARGKYKNKKKEGLWTLCKDSLIIGTENYKNGVKNGESFTFYAENGQVSAHMHWTNGVENGVRRQYYLNGNKRLEAKIVNGKRDGIYLKYHNNGKLATTGKFKNGREEGAWKYYNRDGKQVEVVNYVDGKSDKKDKLDKKLLEEFQNIKQNDKKFIDPAKYKNNPQEYFERVRANQRNE